jgi:hypothetical protein
MNKAITDAYAELLKKANLNSEELFVTLDSFKNFSKIKVISLNKWKEDAKLDYREYRAETNKEYILIKLFKNFLSVGRDEIEMYSELNCLPVAFFNLGRRPTIEEIADKLKFKIPEDYVEFD